MDYGMYTPLRNRRRIRPFVQLSNLTNTSYEEIPACAMPGRSILGGFELLVFRQRDKLNARGA